MPDAARQVLPCPTLTSGLPEMPQASVQGQTSEWRAEDSVTHTLKFESIFFLSLFDPVLIKGGIAGLGR